MTNRLPIKCRIELRFTPGKYGGWWGYHLVVLDEDARRKHPNLDGIWLPTAYDDESARREFEGVAASHIWLKDSLGHPVNRPLSLIGTDEVVAASKKANHVRSKAV